MKRVIIRDHKDMIDVEDSSNQKFYAYMTRTKKLRFLSSLGHGQGYGFIDLECTGYAPVDPHLNLKTCIVTAINRGNAVYEFSSYKDMLKFGLNGKEQ